MTEQTQGVVLGTARGAIGDIGQEDAIPRLPIFEELVSAGQVGQFFSDQLNLISVQLEKTKRIVDLLAESQPAAVDNDDFSCLGRRPRGLRLPNALSIQPSSRGRRASKLPRTHHQGARSPGRGEALSAEISLPASEPEAGRGRPRAVGALGMR